MKSRWKLIGLLTLVFVMLTACGQYKSGGNEGQQGDPNPNPEPAPQEQLISKTVTLYFSDTELMDMYKVEKEMEAKEESDFPKLALEQWIQGPEHEQMSGLVPKNTKINALTIEDGLATVDFSSEILNASVGSTGESFILDQLALILKQFGAEKVQVLVDGKKVESLHGHVNVENPYEWVETGNYEIKTL